MKKFNKVGVLLMLIGMFFSSNIHAQYNATTNQVITGTVDANGAPNQLLSAIVGGTANTINIAVSGVTITNVIFDATGSNNGIQIDGVSNITIDNVIVMNANEHGLQSDRVTNLSVSNSSFFNNGLSQDVSSNWAGVNGYNHEPGAFDENDPLEMKFAGIKVLSNTDLLLENNSSYANKGHGIKIELSTNDSDGDSYSGIVRGNIIGASEIDGVPDGNFGDGLLLVNSNNYLIDGNHTLANGNWSAWSGLVNVATDRNEGLDSRNFYGAGIELNSSSNNKVINNIVGTTYDGKALSYNGVDSTGNHKHGIYVRINSANNQIGEPGNPNIVGGNGYAFQGVHTKDSDPRIPNYLFGVAHGITIHDDGGFTRNNNVQSNFIGYYDGACIPNRQDQVSFLGFYGGESGGALGGLGGNLIGGATTDLGNVIGGGEYAIFAQGPWVGKDDADDVIHGTNVLQGNFIGVDENLAATSCIPNLGGIVVQSGAVNLEIKENVISNLNGTAIEVKGDETNTIEITENILSCNNIGIDLVDNGNNSFGLASPTQLSVNTAASDDDGIVGFSPNSTDRIDVYRADICAGNVALPCQAVGGGLNAQGAELITTINAEVNIDYAAEITEQGYFEFDLTSALAISGGLTHDNIIFIARDVDNNTSEIHRCVDISLCEAPVSVDVTSDTEFNLCEGESADITATLTRATGDTDPLTDFRFSLYLLPNVTTAIETNATGDFTVTAEGTYSIRAFNIENEIDCGTWSDDDITIGRQTPVTPVTIVQDKTLCSTDENVVFTATGQTGSSYTWSTTPSGLTFTTSGNTITIDQVITDFTLSVIETTASPFSCNQDPVSLDVTVNSLPITPVILGNDPVTCSADGEIYSVQNPNSNSRFIWTYGVAATGTPIEGDTTIASSATVDFGPRRALISVQEISEFGCESGVGEINPEMIGCELTADFTVDAPDYCFGETVTLTEQALYLDPNLEPLTMWFVFGPNANKVIGLVTPGGSVEVEYSQPGTYNVGLIVQQAGLADTLDSIGVVVIKPLATIGGQTLVGATSVCQNTSSDYSISSTNTGSTYSWTYVGASELTGSTDIAKSLLFGPSSDDVTIKVIENRNGCIDSLTMTVDVIPSPSILDFTGGLSACVGEPLTVVLDGAIANSSYDWTVTPNAQTTTLTNNDRTGTFVFAAAGDYEISVLETNINGCSSVDSISRITVTINPLPTGVNISGDADVCAGDEEVYSVIQQAGFTYDWNVIAAGGQVAENPNGTEVTVIWGEVSGSVEVTETNGFGCTALSSSLLNVNVNPLPLVKTINGDNPICAGEVFTYSVASTNGSSYTWTQDGTTLLSNADTVTITIPEATRTILTVVEENAAGCITPSSDTLIIDINERPVPINLAATPGVDVCIGNDYQVSVDAQVDVEFTWSSNPVNMITTNTLQSTLDLKGIVSGEIYVSATNSVTGCMSNTSEVDTIEIIIHELPVVSIVGEDSVTCSEDGVVFNVENPNATSNYTWTFENIDNSIPLDGVISNVDSAIVDFGPRRGTIKVFETDIFGCVSELEEVTPVMTGCALTADFIVDAPDYCLGDTVTVTEKAFYLAPEIEVLNMYFIFGTGVTMNGVTVDTVPVLPGGFVKVVYDAPGFYSIKMVVEQQGKEATIVKDSIVEIKALATITAANISGSLSVCQNDEEVYEVVNPTGTYTWTHSGASVVSTIGDTVRTLRFGPTDDDVTITVAEDRDGCLAEASILVDVLSSPEKHELTSTPVCEGENVIVTLTGGTNTSTYVWSPTPVSLANNDTEATYNYTVAGNYPIRVDETNAEGCTALDSASETEVVIKAIPNDPIITGAGLAGVCVGEDAVFTTLYNPNHTYTWDVAPDVTSSISINMDSIVVTPIVGIRTVTLFVTDNGCSSGVVDSTYLVEETPDLPIISGDVEFCQDHESALFVIQAPNLLSTYVWDETMSDAFIDGSFNVGPGNDQIRIDLGSESGQITVKEISSLGCESLGSASFDVNIKRDLGEPQKSDPLSEICSNVSFDSLARYEVTVDEATNITYSASSPFAIGIESGVGETRNYDVTFLSQLEESTVTISALAVSELSDGSVCDEETITWNINIRGSDVVSVGITNPAICEGEDGTYIASLSPSIDSKATYTWFVNDDSVGTGDTIVIPGLDAGNKVEVFYTPSDEICVNIDKSDLDDDERANVISEIPLSVNANITGDGVSYEGDDANGYGVYKISSQIDVTVEAELVSFAPSVENNYTYEISYDQENIDETILVGSGDFILQTEGESSSTLDMPAANSDNEGVRWYTVKAFVGDSCPQEAEDLVKLVIKYQITPRDIFCEGCPENGPTWEIVNIEQFRDNKVVIFNRWGGIVKTYGPGEYENDNGWNGTNDNGKELPVGTYFYTIDLDNGTAPYRGTITMIR